MIECKYCGGAIYVHDGSGFRRLATRHDYLDSCDECNDLVVAADPEFIDPPILQLLNRMADRMNVINERTV